MYVIRTRKVAATDTQGEMLVAVGGGQTETVGFDYREPDADNTLLIHEMAARRIAGEYAHMVKTKTHATGYEFTVKGNAPPS